MRNGPACLCMRTSDTRPRESSPTAYSPPRRSQLQQLGRKLARRSTTIARKIKRTCWTLQLHCMLAFGVVVVASIGPQKARELNLVRPRKVSNGRQHSIAASQLVLVLPIDDGSTHQGSTTSRSRLDRPGPSNRRRRRRRLYSPGRPGQLQLWNMESWIATASVWGSA